MYLIPLTIQQLQFSNNFPVLRVQDGFPPLTVLLKKNGVTVLDETYMHDSASGFKLSLRSLLHSLLTLDKPTQAIPIEEISKNYDDFHILVNGEYMGCEPNHPIRIVKGGIGIEGIGLEEDYALDFCKSRFLTWQPALREVTSLQHHYLVYYAPAACTLRYVVNVLTYKEQALEADKCYRIDLGVLDYDPATLTSLSVYVEYPDESTTIIQTYQIIRPKTETTDVFVFENSAGGFDTVEFTGTLTESDDHDIQKAIINEEMREYAIDYKRVFKKNTGYISTEAERLWLRDFYTSLQKWHYTQGQLRRIYLKSWENETEKGELNQASFSFVYAQDDGLNNIV